MKDQATGAAALFDNPVAFDNLIFDTDSYKLSHFSQYPKGTQYVSSYIEPRRAWVDIDRVMFFGLQIELAKLAGKAVTQAMLDEAAPFFERARQVDPLVAETAGKFVNAVIAAGDGPLQIGFRRDPQVDIDVQGIVVG